MNKNNILIGIIALLVGIVGTNAYNSQKDTKNTSMTSGMHMMADGTRMGNGGMDSMMDGMLENMKGKSGKELEKVFLTDMILHHQGAVDMAKMLLQDKTVGQELVKFANDIISAQEREIGQISYWLKNY